ncbi:C-terminal binding protein [soil metagenome]
MNGPAFDMVITSDRYDLAWEEEHLANLPDMEISLRVGVCGSEEALVKAIADADAVLLTSRDEITPHVISQLRKCKVISRYAVGIDHIDLEAASERGIVITHAPDYCTNEVADHALSLILGLNRRIVELHQDLHAGSWNEHAHQTKRILRGPILPLRETTVGIVGLGRIGTAVAHRLAPFGAQIVAVDPYLAPEVIRQRGAEPVDFQDLAKRADIISIHCPLTLATHGMVDAQWLAALKSGVQIVNTARGLIVNLEDLISALQDNHVSGAALDVVYPEPLPPESALYKLPNVILTPHSAYYSERSIAQVRRDALDGALCVLRGQFPRVVANPSVASRVKLAPYAR